MLRLNWLALNALVLNSYAHYWLQGDVKNIKVIYWPPIGYLHDKDSIDFLNITYNNSLLYYAVSLYSIRH